MYFWRVLFSAALFNLFNPQGLPATGQLRANPNFN